jgi:hypothetical protein
MTSIGDAFELHKAKSGLKIPDDDIEIKSG